MAPSPSTPTKSTGSHRQPASSSAPYSGAPLGWLSMRLLLSSTFNDEGLQAGELIKAPSPLWLLGMLVAIAVVAIAGSILPARRAVRLSVSEALRYE